MSRWTPALYAAETTSSLSAILDPSRSPQEIRIAGPPPSSTAEQTTSFDASTAANSTAAIARRAADAGALVVPRRSTPLSTVSRPLPSASAAPTPREANTATSRVMRAMFAGPRARPAQSQHRLGRLDHGLQLRRRGLGERAQRRGFAFTPAAARPHDLEVHGHAVQRALELVRRRVAEPLEDAQPQLVGRRQASVAQLRVVRSRRHGDGARWIVAVDGDGLHEARDDRGRVADRQLVEQEAELLVVRGVERGTRRRREGPRAAA